MTPQTQDEHPLTFRRIDPAREEGRLREFLSSVDPDDYLLRDLEEWVHEGRLWVGEEEGAWVAFARFHDLGDGEGWLSGARVVPARRGRGVGGQLLDALLQDGRAIGVTAFRAAIEESNMPSRRVFDRFGFQPVVTMALRRGFAASGSDLRLRRADPGEGIDGPVGWLPEYAHRVDKLPDSDGGRFGTWRPSLLVRWANEGKLYVGPGLAAAVQLDWWKTPRTLWVNPLRGELAALVPALNALTRELNHEEWQAFFPSTDPLRAECAALGLVPHPAWGDRVRLYERVEAATPRP